MLCRSDLCQRCKFLQSKRHRVRYLRLQIRKRGETVFYKARPLLFFSYISSFLILKISLKIPAKSFGLFTTTTFIPRSRSLLYFEQKNMAVPSPIRAIAARNSKNSTEQNIDRKIIPPKPIAIKHKSFCGFFLLRFPCIAITPCSSLVNIR